jgi:drug/metabolite transporter (DMT)-like permease
MAGLGLLSLGPEILAGGPILSADTAFGDLVVFGCAIAFAVQIVLLGRFAPRHEAVSLTLMQVAVAAALSVALALLLERPSAGALGPILPAAAFTGVFATVAAFIVQTRAQRFTTPTHTALIFATEPVFGAAFAYALAGETLALPALVGCALILAGMVVAQVAE